MAWAEECGYSYLIQRLPENENPLRSRYQPILKSLEFYDEVLWLDCDIVPVSRKPVACNPVFDVMISVDYNGLCAGAVLWKANALSRWICQGVRLALPVSGRMDDQTIIKQITGMPWMDNRIGWIPETEIANPCSRIEGDPVLMHLWSSSDYKGVVAKAVELAARFLNQESAQR